MTSIEWKKPTPSIAESTCGKWRIVQTGTDAFQLWSRDTRPEHPGYCQLRMMGSREKLNLYLQRIKNEEVD